MKLCKQMQKYDGQGSAVWHVPDCYGLLLGRTRPGVSLFTNCPSNEAEGWMFDMWWKGEEYAYAQQAYEHLQGQIFSTRRDAMQALESVLLLLDSN